MVVLVWWCWWSDVMWRGVAVLVEWCDVMVVWCTMVMLVERCDVVGVWCGGGVM